MVLSILIPTYNYNCTRLVRDLHGQAECAGIDYEIIVADDASTVQDCKESNREINTLPHCRLVELGENVGRARIRNRLADEAKGEWLLFMDCDAEVVCDSFIRDYLAHTEADVVCGRMCHAEALPSPEVSLRYAYERRADKKRAARYRERKPYDRFISFCFMVRASVFHTIRFDERITEYGYEDTLFGIELEKRQVRIKHIDSPMRQGGIETNEEFLKKTCAALRNLIILEDAMLDHSALLKTYRLIHAVGLDRCVARWYTRNEQSVMARLTGAMPPLWFFFLFKLGYYCTLKNNL